VKDFMRPLWLDYRRPVPGHHWPGWLLLVVGLLVCGILLVQSSSTSRQMSVIEQDVFRLKRQVEHRRMLAQADGQGKDEFSQGQRIRQISPLNIRWASLLLALEQSIDDSVTLLGLEPGGRDITIAGEARNIGALLDYIKRLQAAPVFIDVYLTKHEIVQASPYQPVRFSLQASWREKLP
jgi:Tfp pilus assembly protein PilN